MVLFVTVAVLKKSGWGARGGGRSASPPQWVLCDLHPGVVFSPLFGSILMVLLVTAAVCCCCFCCCCCCCCCCHCFEDRRHLFLSQLFLCLSFDLSFNNCCGCGGCGAGCGCACACDCGCCGCGGRRRRRLPSKGRVGFKKKKRVGPGGRGGRAQRLPPQCVLCDLHPGVVFSPLFGSILMLLFVTVAVCCFKKKPVGGAGGGAAWVLCDLHPGVAFSPLFGSILMVSFVTVAVCRCCCCCCCCCFEDRRHLFLSQLFLYLSFYLSFNNCCGCGGCGAGCGCGCACDGGCCGCGGRRRRLPSKGRVGFKKKKRVGPGGRGARAQRLPPQCVLCDLHPGVVFSPLFGSILMVLLVTVCCCCFCCCCCHCFEDRRHLFLSQLFLYLSFYLCNTCCAYGSCYFAFFYLHVHQVTQGSGKYMRHRSVSIHSVHAITSPPLGVEP